jgi:hypothetical protein
MPTLSTTLTSFVAAAVLLFANGCSSQTTVEGDVTYAGQPVSIGRILFVPEDPKAAKRGGRFENGHYKLEAPEGPPPGKHRVEINWLKPTGETYKNEFGDVLPRLAEGLPGKYHQDSTLTATVRPGHNQIDFQLEK